MPSPIFHYTILAKNRLDFPAGSLYLPLFFYPFNCSHSASLKPVRTKFSPKTSGRFNQHTVGCKKLKLLLLTHGRQFILESKLFIKIAAGVKKLFERQTAFCDTTVSVPPH